MLYHRRNRFRGPYSQATILMSISTLRSLECLSKISLKYGQTQTIGEIYLLGRIKAPISPDPYLKTFRGWNNLMSNGMSGILKYGLGRNSRMGALKTTFHRIPGEKSL